jgi:hypothetical protein
VTVSVVVFVFEVADHEAGLEQGVPVVAVEAVWRCGARSHSRDQTTVRANRRRRGTCDSSDENGVLTRG